MDKKNEDRFTLGKGLAVVAVWAAVGVAAYVGADGLPIIAFFAFLATCALA